MNRDPKENNTTELTKEFAQLADTLSRSQYQDIVLYDDPSETLEGIFDGQIYDFEIEALHDVLLEIGVEDVQLPITISADVKNSHDPIYPVILQTKCAFGDFGEITLFIPYSKDFKRASMPLLIVKRGEEKGRSERLDSAIGRLFEIENNIFMRRLTRDEKIRPRIKYRVDRSI
jgi:hypothetical protein